MNEVYSTSTLASYATIKSLYDSKRYSNPYQVLLEFIGYIIKNEKLYNFCSIEIKDCLFKQFGFVVPEAVVRTTLKKATYITLSNGMFSANINNIDIDASLETTKENVDIFNSNVISQLLKYIKKSAPDKDINQKELEKEFIAFLIDDQENEAGTYTKQISQYILENEHNVEMQGIFKAIREGSILYIGLNYNINETGSLTKQITLFLGTEVLFSLAGYNGDIHKQLANDLFSLIRAANSTAPRIVLLYFEDVKKEIDNFFDAAALIVDSKSSDFNSVAMSSIINHCETSSDVRIKQSDFYHMLQFSYGIKEDIKNNYYSENYNAFNLESGEFTDPQIQISWKFISHINKLRKGVVYYNDTDCEYLAITNTKSTLDASKKQSEQNIMQQGLEYVNDYAVSIAKMTNILWYKLGKGFGNSSYPSNVDAVLKARVVLASDVSHNIANAYHKVKEQFYKGEITKEQVAARIITLRRKPFLPEELEGDCIEDIMDFSPEYLARFEEEARSNKAEIEEKELLILQIEKQNARKLQYLNKEMAQKDQVLQQQKNELIEYRKKEDKKKRRHAILKSSLRLAFRIGWKLAVMAVLIRLAVYLEDKFNSNLPIYFFGAVDVIGLIVTGWITVKKDYSECFSHKAENPITEDTEKENNLTAIK